MFKSITENEDFTLHLFYTDYAVAVYIWTNYADVLDSTVVLN